MNKVKVLLMYPLLSLMMMVIFTPRLSYSEDSPSETRVFDWNELKRADGNVEFFNGKAWFCQAKTATGKTECHLGAKPPKPGCYVLLNSTRTAWIAADDAAAQLGAKFLSDGKGKENLSSASGYGCGRPRSGDWWLLVDIK